MAVTRARPAILSAGGRDAASSGMRAASTWLGDRGIDTPTLKRWHIEVSLSTLDINAPVNYDDRVDTRFHVDIYSEEWGFFFCHGGRASWIRVTDIPFVHGRDDFALLAMTPTLGVLGSFLRRLELDHGVRFRREHALVHTDLIEAEPAIRRWLLTM